MQTCVVQGPTVNPMLVTNRGLVQQNVTLELPGLQVSSSVKWG